MAITEDLRKTLTDPTPFYAAAGATDLAAEKLKEVPAMIEKFRAEAPERIAAVRSTDPKAVQERVTKQAKEAQVTVQNKMTDVLSTLDTDLKKLREQAQDLAYQGMGKAAQYAAKARDTYDELAERGQRAVKTWRGETAEGINEIAVAVEPEPERKAEPKATEAKSGQAGQPRAGQAEQAKPAAARKPAPRKPAAKKPAPKSSE
jgi:heparin binding hemagglutinin HbhA